MIDPACPTVPLVEQIYRDMDRFEAVHHAKAKYLVVSHNVLDKLRASRNWPSYGQLLPGGAGIKIAGLVVATIYTHDDTARCEVVGTA